MPDIKDEVSPEYWRLTLMNIRNGNGVAVVTLKSGVQLTGKVDRLSASECAISLKSGEYSGGCFTPDGGWHVIDFTTVAAISGKVDR